MEKAVAVKREAEAVRVVFIDRLSPRMFPPTGPYTLKMVPAKTPSELRALLDKHLQDAGWIRFIKRGRTPDVLRTEFAALSPEPNRETYRYEPGGILPAAVLRRRPARGGPCLPAAPEGLSYWLVIVKLEAAEP